MNKVFHPISTPEELDSIRNNPDYNYILTRNIDMSNWGNWEPINNFKGFFDGQGYTIKNLTINKGSTTGFFSSLRYPDIVVTSIIFENPKIVGGSRTGVVAGDLVGGNNIRVQNIDIINGDIKGPVYTGGVVGNIGPRNRVSMCRISGTIHGGSRTGGIAGNNNGIIEFCHVKDFQITSNDSSHGGIQGQMYDSNSIVRYCISEVVGGNTIDGRPSTYGEIHDTYYNKTLNSNNNGMPGGIGLTQKELELGDYLSEKNFYNFVFTDLNGKEFTGWSKGLHGPILNLFNKKIKFFIPYKNNRYIYKDGKFLKAPNIEDGSISTFMFLNKSIVINTKFEPYMGENLYNLNLKGYNLEKISVGVD